MYICIFLYLAQGLGAAAQLLHQALAALATMLVAVGGANVALAARQEQNLRCNSACNTQELLTAADGVIASCRQNTMI